jgi:hypothetical protein
LISGSIKNTVKFFDTSKITPREPDFKLFQEFYRKMGVGIFYKSLEWANVNILVFGAVAKKCT